MLIIADVYSHEMPHVTTASVVQPRPDVSGFSKLATPTLPVLTDQEYIEHAARKAEQLLQRDLECPTLYNSLTVPAGQNVAYAGNPVTSVGSIRLFHCSTSVVYH